MPLTDLYSDALSDPAAFLPTLYQILRLFLRRFLTWDRGWGILLPPSEEGLPKNLQDVIGRVVKTCRT
ncbi:hypothetical protein R5O87_08265 [Arthrobacter globiformis]|uniref:hypothetical protein n=1 Tax=Arthrobacter globiformis TaxID=1665 RepID=UPI00397D6472